MAEYHKGADGAFERNRFVVTTKLLELKSRQGYQFLVASKRTWPLRSQDLFFALKEVPNLISAKSFFFQLNGRGHDCALSWHRTLLFRHNNVCKTL